MRACLVTAPHRAEVRRVAMPEVPRGWVLARVHEMGVCGTDGEIFTGELPYLRAGVIRFPVIPGHEWTGEVAAVGGDVAQVAVGDRVTGETHVGCGRCAACLSGGYNQCKQMLRVGIGDLPGACADYVLLPEKAIHRLPDSILDEDAILIEPSTVVHRALLLAGFSGGERVMIFGPGTLGLLGISIARVLGAVEVAVAGTREERLALARRLGADHVFNVRAEPRRLRQFEGWADTALEASGSSQAIVQAVAALRNGGCLSLVSLYKSPLAEFDPNTLVTRNLRVVGSLGSPGIWERTIRLMAAGRIATRGLVTHRFDLDQAPEAFELAISRGGGAIKVAITMDRHRESSLT